MWATKVTREGKIKPSSVKKLYSFLPVLHLRNLHSGGSSGDSFQPSLEREAYIVST